MKSVPVTILSLVLALAPRLAAGDDDPGAGKHAQLVAAMTKAACVPPASVVVSKKDSVTNGYSVFLGVENNALVACASRSQSDVMDKPFQCWTIDPTTNALAARPASLLPGHTYGVASACGEGFCKPKEKPATTSDIPEILTVSADGSKVARFSAETIQIFDAKTKAFQREFPMMDKAGKGNPFGVHDAFYVGDMLVIVGLAAGPDGGAFLYNASKGTFVGPVGKGAGADVGYVSVYGGGYELVDATHFVAHDGGYEEATVDLTTGAISTRSMPTPAGCTAEDVEKQRSFDNVGDGEKPKAKCTKALRAAMKKFWGKPPATQGMISVGGTGYKLVHGAKAELLVLPAGAKKPKSVPLPVCKVK